MPNGTLDTHSYDATGLRRQSQTGAGAVKFVLDSQDVLLETDAGGDIHEFAHAHGVGGATTEGGWGEAEH